MMLITKIILHYITSWYITKIKNANFKFWIKKKGYERFKIIYKLVYENLKIKNLNSNLEYKIHNAIFLQYWNNIANFIARKKVSIIYI